MIGYRLLPPAEEEMTEAALSCDLAKAGLGEAPIPGWVDRAGLFRVKGVGTQCADLIGGSRTTAGEDYSFLQLFQNRNPRNL